ncbi:hypothetical protein HAX54_049419 [Datura stramonium]|uniref:Uncharacterized protein n=1 Tax=Datura stramonium TaxID=4076 RepID=A0ABS8SUV6_DATST|nr:hypothetical protein [Datura stramonium]
MFKSVLIQRIPPSMIQGTAEYAVRLPKSRTVNWFALNMVEKIEQEEKGKFSLLRTINHPVPWRPVSEDVTKVPVSMSIMYNNKWEDI